MSIRFDETTEFSWSFFSFLHGRSTGCSSVSWNPTPLKILSHYEEAAEEPGCGSTCKATQAAPSATPVEMSAFNKLGKIIFILIIWSWSFGVPTCYLRDFHRPSWSCHKWQLSLEQRKQTHVHRRVLRGKHTCPWSFPVSRSAGSQSDVISWRWGSCRGG